MNRLTTRLRELQLSQSELARRTGMHPSSVSMIVNGRMLPYPSQLSKIAEALDWSGDPDGLLDVVTDDGAD